MAEYLVKMADERGHVLQQVESGVSEQEIKDRFAQQGFMVYSVKSRRGLLPMGGKGRKKLLRADQFVVFNQQFLTLIKAGLPIIKSLHILSKRQKNANFKAILEDVQERVKSGSLLSEAFEAQGATSKIYTTTLLAGERSGNLEEVLGRYITFQRITVSFRKKLIASLWYPALLVCALTVMLTFLMAYVVPQFADLYTSLNAKLPAMTIFMLGIGRGIQNYYYIILAAILALGLMITLWVRSDKGSRMLDAIRYKLPLFGDIWMKYQIAMFSRTLSTLLSGGLPLVPSLETASHSINSFKISSNVEYASRRVREGRALSFSLEETGFFPDMAVEMVEVGESTGALPAMLNSVAEFYEEDVQNSLATAMQLIEPIILIFMGITVAFVLLSLYMPIFSLGAQVQQ
ncbi:MAG TPA: type II secretion system F family protein [Candidatus Angelobacter sp.]|jgi:type IV pilus assembly protein PilC